MTLCLSGKGSLARVEVKWDKLQVLSTTAIAHLSPEISWEIIKIPEHKGSIHSVLQMFLSNGIANVF